MEFIARCFKSVASLLLVLFAVALCVIAGCGPSSSTVSGKVTLDGQPLANGSISFTPEDGQTATAGAAITNGAYTVELPPGKKRVEISATKVVGQVRAYEGDPNSPMMDDVRPIEFTSKSPMTVDIAAGENQHNFELQSVQ